MRPYLRRFLKFYAILALGCQVLNSVKADVNIIAPSLIKKLDLCQWILRPPQRERSSVELALLKQLKGVVGLNSQNYSQDRLLVTDTTDWAKSYRTLLSDGAVEDILTSLTASDVWVDGGAGNFGAMWEYFQIKRGVPAKRIGIVPKISMPENRLIELVQKDPQFFPLLGLTVERVDMIPSASVNVVTDVFGAFSYSQHPDVVLQQYLRWLKKGGVIYLTQRAGNGFGLTEFPEDLELFRTVWPYLSVDSVHLETWLKGGSGFSFSFDKDTRKLKIIKQQDEFSLPELTPVFYRDENPPSRIFKLSGRTLRP